MNAYALKHANVPYGLLDLARCCPVDVTYAVEASERACLTCHVARVAPEMFERYVVSLRLLVLILMPVRILLGILSGMMLMILMHPLPRHPRLTRTRKLVPPRLALLRIKKTSLSLVREIRETSDQVFFV